MFRHMLYMLSELAVRPTAVTSVMPPASTRCKGCDDLLVTLAVHREGQDMHCVGASTRAKKILVVAVKVRLVSCNGCSDWLPFRLAIAVRHTCRPSSGFQCIAFPLASVHGAHAGQRCPLTTTSQEAADAASWLQHAHAREQGLCACLPVVYVIIAHPFSHQRCAALSADLLRCPLCGGQQGGKGAGHSVSGRIL